MSDFAPAPENVREAVAVPPGRWLHRAAVVIVALVWPLIWVGGQVTTYDAGMAVPDWPGTYGYNLFLYPYQTWLFGPFDLFIEHGHRLLGALVGLVSIVAVGFAFVTEPRRWVRSLAVAVLVAVIAQGALGGARVVMADRTLAMVHGCVAQLFFTLCVALVVVTSRWWWTQSLSENPLTLPLSPAARGEREPSVPLRGRWPRFRIGSQPALASGYRPSGRFISVVGVLTCLCYLQVVLGAQLRHVQPTASPGGFSHHVATHIVTALVVLGLAVAVNWRLFCLGTAEPGVLAAEGGTGGSGSKKRTKCGDLTLSGPALLLLTFVVLQISLGLATWVARYGMPAFAQIGPRTASYLVKSQAFVPSLIITGHVAIGAMVLATSAFLLLRLLRARYARGPVMQASPSPDRLEVFNKAV